MDFEDALDPDFTDEDSLDDTLKKLTLLLDSLDQPKKPEPAEKNPEPEALHSTSVKKPLSHRHAKEWETQSRWKPHMEEKEAEDTPFLLQNGRLAVAILLTLVLAACAVVFLGGKLLKKSESAKIRSGISVAGVDVSRMSYPEDAVPFVADVLDNRFWEAEMVVMLEGERLVFTPDILNPIINMEALVADAYEHSQETPDSEEPYDVPLAPYLTVNTDYFRTQLEERSELFSTAYHPSHYYLEGAAPDLADENFSSQPRQTLVLEVGKPGSVLDLESVYQQILDAYTHSNFFLEINSNGEELTPEPLDLQAIWQEITVPAQDISVDPVTYTLNPGTWGCTFDLADAEQQVAQAQEDAIIRIPLTYVAPQLSKDSDLFRDCRGQASLTLSDTPSDTLRLLCDKINGLVVENGKTLSLLELYGDVLEQHDCRNGTKEDESGCILASALWQASLCAEVDVWNVAHHNFAPAFCEPGTDILLRPASDKADALPQQDLTIQNNTRHPIMILAECSGTELVLRIYGTETRDYSVTLESILHPKDDPKTVYQEIAADSGIADGTVLQEGHGNSSVEVMRCRYRLENGELISKVFGAYVSYPGCPEIIAQVPET